MTEQQMEKIAARAANIAVTKFREMLKNELQAVLHGVATLDPILMDGVITQWVLKETNQHIHGAWVPQQYSSIERLTMAIGRTGEFKAQLSSALRNVTL